ncbi:MAG: alkaline phosphatase family protein [Gemmatimonadales bacterium]
MLPNRLVAALILSSGLAPAPAQAPRVERLIVVTLDGLRWQEVFGGASIEYFSRAGGGVRDSADLARQFWRSAPEERRAALMPFLWGTIAREGQIFGDSTAGSPAVVTNGLWFSYPGYNELLAGAADPRIDSNDKVPNPNPTVLEWLNGLPGYRGRVAAFGSWDVLPFIVNSARSGVYVNGSGPPVARPVTARERELNALASDLPPVWGESARLDAPTMWGALEHLRRAQPRVLYVMLGETDEWAHGRRYDLYLDAARRGDAFVRRLWETAQTLPGFRGRTALVLTTDHGRGDAPRSWTDHGREVPAARRIWIAVLGPTVPPLGVRRATPTTQSQVAATIAALLGLDFHAATPGSAPPLPLRP